MRIGIDARLPYYRQGGISQYLLHLIQYLAEIDRTNEYTILQLKKDGADYTPAADNFKRSNLFTPCHHRFERLALTAELALKPRLDLLHSPDFIPPFSGGKRHVITIHDLNFIYFPQFLTADSRRYYADQIEAAVAKADHISADSHHTRQDIIDILNVPAHKVTTIHLSVNKLYQQSYSPQEIEKTLASYNLPRGYILAVGTIEPRKNYDTLLEAYEILRNSGSADIPLVIIGSPGWLHEDFASRIAAHRYADTIFHLTGIFDQQLAHFYHGAGVLVTPSHYEGFGLPGLEALNCGCPIILSNRGSLPEIVGQDAGLLLEPTDAEAWAAAIEQVLHDSALRQKMIEAGYRHAATFSWEKAARETLAIYHSISQRG